jgi:hypothetical protein
MFFAAIICSTPSCKKSAVDTILTRLQHTWKLTKIATDDNGNGAIDASEIQPLTNGQDDRITFNKDGSGKEVIISTNGVQDTYTFSWSLGIGDTLNRHGAGNDIIKYHIGNISTSSLELATITDKNILAAYFYDRK